MKARAYSVVVHTGCGKSLNECRCGTGMEPPTRAVTAKSVIAIDSRDVEPLIEAAREALTYFEGPENQAGEALADALEPFTPDTGEEKR
jgi:hypothetical protein